MIEMRTVELAAPDLVQRVRTGGGGKGGKGVLTRARLEAIVTNLPGDWETQRLMADLAVARNILADDLDFLSWSFAQAKEAFDQETMTKILTEPELLLKPQPASLPSSPNWAGYFPAKKHRLPRRVEPEPAPEERASTAIDEIKVLRKHQVPKVIEALMRLALADKGNDLTILSLPQGQIILNQTSGVMRLCGRVTELTGRETELMVVFSLLEGMTISERLLSLISLNGSRGNTREAVESLQIKLSELSMEAARELRVSRKHGYSWLAE